MGVGSASDAAPVTIPLADNGGTASKRAEPKKAEPKVAATPDPAVGTTDDPPAEAPDRRGNPVVASLEPPRGMKVGAVGGTTTPEATPQSRINEIGRQVVDAILPGNNGMAEPQRALDILHGQRRQNDPDFDRRVIDAIRNDPRMTERASWLEAVYGIQPAQMRTTDGARAQIVDRLFQRGDGVLFDAYLNNPGGVSRPEDIARIGVQGMGNDISTIRNLYADILARYPRDEQGYQAAVRALDAQHAAANGGQTLHQRLTDGLFPELGGDDRRSYLAARMGPQADAALRLYNSVEGRMFASGEDALKVLSENTHRLAALASDYRALAGRYGGHGRLPDMDGIGRITAAVRGRLSPQERARYDILVDPKRNPEQRARDYVRETLSQYTRNLVDGESLRYALDMIGNGRPNGRPPIPAAFTPAQMLATMRPELEAAQRHANTGGRGPYGGTDYVTQGMLQEVIENQRTSGTYTVGAELQVELNAAYGNREKMLAVARRIDLLPPEVRADMARIFSPQELARYMGRGSLATLRVNGNLHDTSLGRRFADALAGRNNDAAALMRGAALPAHERTARPDDVIDALRAMRPSEIANFPRNYGPNFERDLAALGSDAQRQIRGMVSLPFSMAPEHRDDAISNIVRNATNAATGEQSGLGGALTAAFGRTTPVLNDATRRLVQQAERLRLFDSMSDSERRAVVQELVLAHGQFTRALATTASERREVVDNAALITTSIIGVATGWGAITTARIVMAANAVGITAVGTKAALLGDRYTAEDAMFDFITNAGFEAGGTVAFQGLFSGVARLRRRRGGHAE